MSNAGGVYTLERVSLELTGPELATLSDLIGGELRKNTSPARSALQAINGKLQNAGIAAILARGLPAPGWVISTSYKGQPWDTFSQGDQRPLWTDQDGRAIPAAPGRGGLRGALGALADELEADEFFRAALRPAARP